MLERKISVCLVLMLVFGLNLACGLIDQTDKANKIVDEANIAIEQNNARSLKSGSLFTELFGASLVNAKDLEKYKQENKPKFDELVSISEQTEKSTTELLNKFEQAGKLKINEKYKQYLDLKIQEHKKRADDEKLAVPFVKTFLETKDVDKINAQIEEFNKKSAEIVKEAEEFMKKADQLAKDNPDLIK